MFRFLFDQQQMIQYLTLCLATDSIIVQIMRHVMWFLFTSKTMKSLRAQKENQLLSCSFGSSTRRETFDKSAANDGHVYILHYIGVKVQTSPNISTWNQNYLKNFMSSCHFGWINESRSSPALKKKNMIKTWKLYNLQ